MPTPYKVTCTCGADLYIKDRMMDTGGDVIVEVGPCEECLEEAREEEE